MTTTLYRNLYQDMLSFNSGKVESVITRHRMAKNVFIVETLLDYEVIDLVTFNTLKAAIVYAKMMASNIKKEVA